MTHAQLSESSSSPGGIFMRRLVSGAYVPLAVGTLITILIAAQGLTLWRSYQTTWLLAVRSAENALNTISASISRNLSVLELSLMGAQEAIGKSDLADIPVELRQMVLFDRAASAQFLGSMLVLDRDGRIIHDSGSFPPRDGNFRDRDYFTAHTIEDKGTYLSAPFESRLRDNDPSIALSRRVSGQDGQFEGIVLAAIRIAFFKSLIDKINLGPDSVITLTRSNGIVIIRSPSTDGKGNFGASISNSPIFKRMLATPGQAFTDISVFDGVRRYYISTKIEPFPLLLSIGIATEAAMNEWAVNALTSSALTVAMCVLFILLVRALRLALLRSHEIEGQLEALAVTDALTGLPNRRAFNLAIASEMRRAARQRTPLAILLIDVDHFKSINDNYGHGVGDIVLARVASQISRSIRRPGDFAARYGGEEFAAILPSTDAEGATTIAERMRSAIEAMAPCPSQPKLERVTVSIGVSVGLVDPASPPAQIVNRADRALYEAKGGGRNRVIIVTSENTP